VTGDEIWSFHQTPESKQQFPQNQKIQNFSFSEKNSWRPLSGTEKAFFSLISCLLAQQLMPLRIVTP
jgi:hypothetical protein